MTITTVPGLCHQEDRRLVAFCPDPLCRPAYDGPTSDLVVIPAELLNPMARCFICGALLLSPPMLPGRLTTAQVAEVIAEYDRIVRLNDAVQAVAADIDGEIGWEVLDTAVALGVLPKDPDAQADAACDQLRDAVEVYRLTLCHELHRGTGS